MNLFMSDLRDVSVSPHSGSGHLLCHRRRTLTEATSHFYQLDETSSSFWPLSMRNNPMSNRIVHQLRDRVEAQFPADIDPVRLYRSYADLQPCRRLFARHTVGQQPHDFALAFGQL